jgi:hypothetical protein
VGLSLRHRGVCFEAPAKQAPARQAAPEKSQLGLAEPRRAFWRGWVNWRQGQNHSLPSTWRVSRRIVAGVTLSAFWHYSRLTTDSRTPDETYSVRAGCRLADRLTTVVHHVSFHILTSSNSRSFFWIACISVNNWLYNRLFCSFMVAQTPS